MSAGRDDERPGTAGRPVSDPSRRSGSMYDRILVAIDPHPTEENLSAIRRTEEIGRLTGAVVHVLHIARGHIVPEDITGGSGRLGVCPRPMTPKRRIAAPFNDSSTT
jgi:hypothetical protein